MVLTQLIDKPTHILPNSSTCIDLVFTSSPKFVIDSGVHASLHPRSHHQVIYTKLNFKVHFSPSYKRKIWDFSQADIDSIRQAILEVDWERSFSNLNINEKVMHLTDCIQNIFSNFVPNKIVTVRDKDAPWMTPEVKKLILQKAKIYKRYVKNGRNENDYHNLRECISQCKNACNEAKNAYYTKLSTSLNDPNIESKKYWSIINKFLNKRKIPKIPPITHNNSIVTNIKEKAGLFNEFFANQCRIIETDTILPEFTHLTDLRLNSVLFDRSKILSLIRSLNTNKAHGWDEISVRMIKICDESLVKPLEIIFTFCSNNGVYPSYWKKGNICPVHKKNDKSILNNYRPISLLPIFSKIFEKCIYDTIYTYFEVNNLFSPHQSGFRKNDSCVSQLLSITHEIFKNFDANPSLDTRGIFLDISKAFDRVWHEGLLFKLKSYGICGPLLSLLKEFLSDRLQRVTLNGQCSSWRQILAGVPQGSILGPLLFLIFINDLPDNLESTVKIFADDTSLFSATSDPQTCANNLTRDLRRISSWADQWKMSFNPDPSKQAVGLHFTRKINVTNIPTASFNGANVSEQDCHKHLGLILDKKLNFDHHLKEKIAKANKGIGMIIRLRRLLSRDILLTIYKSFVRPHLDYGDIVYDHPENNSFSDRLESVQYNAALAITGCFRGTSKEKLYAELGLESLADRRYYRKLCFFYRIINNDAPPYLREYVTKRNILKNNLRNPRTLSLTNVRTERFKNSFFPFCINKWNELDSNTREQPTLLGFKNTLLKFIRPTNLGPSALFRFF